MGDIHQGARPDWKPSARERATRNEWEHLRGEKLGPCRACGGAGQHLHHVVPRSVGGDDRSENLIPLCHICHETYHRANDNGIVAGNIRGSLTNVEAAYVVAKRGKWWLDANYPEWRFEGEGGALCAKCKRPRKPVKREAARPRKRWQISVPADAEDGADVLDGLIDLARERLQEQLGHTEDVPAYYVLVPVLASFLHDERQAA